MIQASGGPHVFYATRLIEGVGADVRVLRRRQSEAAAALLDGLRIRADFIGGASSKSHSRGMVAAAVAPAGQVGIDVEFKAPARNIAAGARWLLGDDSAADEGAAYRAWTFWEAHFKAFGAWPPRELVREAALSDAHISQLGEGVFVLHEQIEGFALTLVWHGGAGAECVTL